MAQVIPNKLLQEKSYLKLDNNILCLNMLKIETDKKYFVQSFKC